MELSNQSSLFPDQKGPGNYGNEYHNTMHLDSKEVEEWRKVVVGQNAKVLAHFANHPHAAFCGWEVSDATGVFITNVRRAINTLTHGGWLKQVGEKEAKKGHKNYTYQFIQR